MRHSTWTKEEESLLRSKNFTLSKFRNKFPSNRKEDCDISSRRYQLRKSLLKRRAKRLGSYIVDGKTYDNSDRKRYIQCKVFSSIRGMRSDVLVLLGSVESSDIYLSLLYKYGIVGKKNVVYSYENDSNRLIQQITKYSGTKGIVISGGDIINAKPELYMDIDLMCQYKNAIGIFKWLFWQQRMMDTENARVFNCAFSYMRSNKSHLKRTINTCLRSLLGNMFSVIGEEVVKIGVNNKHIIQYIVNDWYSKFEVSVYYYSDSSPMVNITIKY